MARKWVPDDFDLFYDQFICQDELQSGGRAYYLRYRSRYKTCIKRLAQIAPPHPIDVLDIGVGQLALLCKKLWNDHAVMADLPGPHLSYMARHGLEAITWDLCASDPPPLGKFDVVFFSEVIEHLPMPGYIALERLRNVLRPGGVIICTTPNFYRLRNVVYMALGLPIFEYFRYPDDEKGLGHVIEYSLDHLRWQFEKAGFEHCRVELVQMHHLPTKPVYRPLALLGYPLHLFPRFRDNLLATATAPCIPGNHAVSVLEKDLKKDRLFG